MTWATDVLAASSGCGLRKSIRGIDLALPLRAARSSSSSCRRPTSAVRDRGGERIRRKIATEPFAIRDGADAIEVTISIGLAALGSANEVAGRNLKRADQALYRAKRDGPQPGGR